ncbi:hypothetical protein [Lactococcus taiwanensis]|uniref:hypothetical protein n=1 Tax=Lactococcus taiwanensis TaxID=1151742 RepID=UPI003514DEF9
MIEKTLKKNTLYGRVQAHQYDDSISQSVLEIKWRTPEGALIKVLKERFDKLPSELFKAKFEEAVHLASSPEWAEEQKQLYIVKLEFEIAERKRKIQLAKLTKKLGEE